MVSFLHKLTRKKNITSIPMDTSLRRCLTTCDLMFMGIGSMVGSGIYIMTGIAAKELAGPSIVLSFLVTAAVCLLGSFCYLEHMIRIRKTGLIYQIMYLTLGEFAAAIIGWLKVVGPAIVLSFMVAAVIAVLAILCFTEFAARVPRSGGSYVYMYASLGELAAFIIGWCILVACINGGATNARAWSAYLDYLVDNRISNLTETYIVEWTVGEPIAAYPDFMASLIILVLTAIVLTGANCSTKFNSMFALANCCILMFVIIMGFVYIKPSNWTSKETKGFMPFGWSGVLSGAGACFWAMTGFEIIGTCTEEAKNPKKSIPLAMGLAIALVTLLYIGTSAALTLMVPYTVLDAEAPLPSAFDYLGIHWAKYIVSVGPLCGLTTTLFASIFSFGRICYAMAEDGLIMSVFGKVSKLSGIPMWSTLLGSIVMALQACFLDIRHILSFGVVLSLFQFILVSASVIILRYRPSEIDKTHPATDPDKTEDHTAKDDKGMAQNILNGDSPQSPEHMNKDYTELHDVTSKLLENEETPTSPANGHLVNNNTTKSKKKRKHKKNETNHIEECGNTEEEIHLPGSLRPAFKPLQRYLNFAPGVWVSVSLLVMIVIMLLFGVAIVYGRQEFTEHVWWSTVTAVLLFIVLIILTFTIVIHKQNLNNLVFKVPCVPIIPSISILFSTLLMVSTATAISWIGFTIVFLLGMLLYFVYGIRHSKLNDGCFELLPLTGITMDDESESDDSDF